MVVNDRIQGALIAHLIADAAGCPYEFRARGTFEVARAMIGWGTHHQPPGEWTDDGALTLAGVDAALFLFEQPDPASEAAWQAALRFGRDAHRGWIDHGRYHRRGRVFDVGGQTSRAIAALGDGPTVDLDRVPCPASSAGNGALMRILGWVFANHLTPGLDDATRVRRLADAGRLTHGTPSSVHACWIYADLVHALVDGASPADALRHARIRHDQRPMFPERARVDAAFDDALAGGRGWTQVGGTGWVIDSLHIALGALGGWNGDPAAFVDVIRSVIALGGDTDTNAAIAAGLLGAAVGREALLGDADTAAWFKLTFDPQYPAATQALAWIEALGRG